MPGLAFTPDGKRLGHGRGHYDRFLAECKERSTEIPKTIGLALRIQMLDDLPIDPLDKIVDLVLHDHLRI
jgi:5-formyltetrahydrofolate cyclo-ligase